VLCEYDYFAEHLYQAATGRGIAIPGKMALAGFGNERYPFPPHGETFLSTIHEDFAEIGRLCAQAVINSGPRINNRPDILLSPVQIPGLSEFKGEVDPGVADTVQFSQAVQSVIAEEPDADDLAGTLAIKTRLSKRYFLQRFKQIYQQTFRDFMNDRRLDRASSMLRNSSEPVIRIAMRCGFNNIQPFNRLFRLKFKTTPTEYRG
jgi:AraC-like DNA-binding protein